jgi:four helix bundle protein
MEPDDLRERLVQFALRILRLCASLPDTPEGRLIRGQLIRCGTSPGAQYREACRARSPSEFISKMESCEQELDETEYWLLLLERIQMVGRAKLAPLQEECRELIRIFASSVNTAKKNRQRNANR